MYVPLNRRVCFLLLWLRKRAKILPFISRSGVPIIIYLLDSTAKGWFFTGLPVAGPVIISIFGCLFRKTNTQGKEDTRSGIKKWFSHNLFPNSLWSFWIELRCEITFPSLASSSFFIIVWNGVPNSCLFVWNRSRISKAQQHTLMVNLRE